MAANRPYRNVAWFYDLIDLPFERRRYAPLRPELFKDAGERILDAGIGTGRNIPFYPPHARVTGIDLSPAMLNRARRRRHKLGANVELVEMDVCRTAFADDSFDTVVATFLFCVLEPDLQLPALSELRRVCSPGGEIRLLEYAYPADPMGRFVMRLWAPWVRWVYGAAFDRDTEQYVPEAGLELVAIRFLFRDIIKLLVVRPRT